MSVRPGCQCRRLRCYGADGSRYANHLHPTRMHSAVSRANRGRVANQSLTNIKTYGENGINCKEYWHQSQLVKNRYPSATVCVGISALVPAVTGDNDVAVPESSAGVGTRTEVDVAVVTGKPEKFAREREAIALGETAGTTDVAPCTFVLSRRGRFPG